jgi:hypothetical protein
MQAGIRPRQAFGPADPCLVSFDHSPLGLLSPFQAWVLWTSVSLGSLLIAMRLCWKIYGLHVSPGTCLNSSDILCSSSGMLGGWTNGPRTATRACSLSLVGVRASVSARCSTDSAVCKASFACTFSVCFFPLIRNQRNWSWRQHGPALLVVRIDHPVCTAE